MASHEEKDKERKGAGVPLLAARGTSAGRLTLGARIESLVNGFLTNPNAFMARGLFGAALAVTAAWTASALAYHLSPDKPAEPGLLSALSRGPVFRGEDGRSALMPMVGGLKMIMGITPPPGQEGGDASQPSGASLGDISAAKPHAPGEGEGEGTKEGEGGKDEKAGGGGTPSLGGLSSIGGGGGGGAGSSAASAPGVGPSGAAGSSSASSGEKTGAAGDYRSTALMRSGKIAASNPARGRGAMKQLKFANNMSGAAQKAPTMGGGYSAAEAAFSGQAPKAGTPAADGGGVQQDGPGPRPQPQSAPINTQSCPAGYFVNGDVCSPSAGDGSNQTPYQGELDAARRYLMIAAVLAAIGLALIAFSGVPFLQILGGLLVGFALIMIVAAAVFGNDIINKFNQVTQGKIIGDAGAAAAKGQAPK